MKNVKTVRDLLFDWVESDRAADGYDYDRPPQRFYPDDDPEHTMTTMDLAELVCNTAHREGTTVDEVLRLLVRNIKDCINLRRFEPYCPMLDALLKKGQK